MKTIVAIVAFIFSVNGIFAQEIHRIRKVVPIMGQQTIYLNGGVRADLGGKSREFVKVDLPPGTVEWYYIFTTQPERAQDNGPLNLVPQLTRLLDPSGGLSILASAVLAPTGSNSCDIYLMDRQNADAFFQKVDRNGGRFTHFISGSRENYKNGTVQINDIKAGTWYLGFRNPSAVSGITITFEVAAIVETATVSTETEKAVGYANIGWQSYQAGDIDRCIECCKKALVLDSTLGKCKANLGLCYLVKGDRNTSTDYYVDALADIKRLPPMLIKHYLQVAIDDINGAMSKYPSLKGAEDIRILLQNELNRH